MSFEQNVRYLRLPFIRDHLEALACQARASNMDHREFVEWLIEEEAASRRNNAIQKRIREAHLPYCMNAEDYETSHLSPNLQKAVGKLLDLDFIPLKEKVVLSGSPGTGKTALACTLATKALLQGMSVLFIRVPDLLTELSEAMSQEQVRRYIKRFTSYDLVVIDELGFTSIKPQMGDMLFNLINARNECGSMIITTNLSFQDWDKVFGSKELAAAMTDRIMYHCWPLFFEGESFRIKNSQRWMQKRLSQAGL